ncbi:hypothetical protein GCM10025858_13550 [Alicyclobacillus sacchari]|uniref:TIGR03826 family flagellar region protein n=1 Tax=Alicyclobacillus sacchari TaxID=392010 RepID=UPI0023EA235F|nr:TIGR03826 family flagellar region protein [Alicyclobacillus sacchari]GMA56852.1 hypothetical protein GCM10025858_13550 [Alicyclobacillus sacchari]
MPIANCKRCGRLYNRAGRDICPECIRQEDAVLLEIRQYLKKHPQANIYEVAEGTNATYEEIVEFLRDGRLILRDNPNMAYPCERCGTLTQSGRLCANCTQVMAKGLGHATATLHRDETQGKRGKGFLSQTQRYVGS